MFEHISYVTTPEIIRVEFLVYYCPVFVESIIERNYSRNVFDCTNMSNQTVQVRTFGMCTAASPSSHRIVPTNVYLTIMPCKSVSECAKNFHILNEKERIGFQYMINISFLI